MFPMKLETAEYDSYDSICQNKPTSSRNFSMKLVAIKDKPMICLYVTFEANSCIIEQMV